MTYVPHVKRTVDIVIAAFAIIVLSPLLFIIIFFILLDSKDFPFFIQERIGRNMKPFRLIKFRSMSSKTVDDGCQFEPGEEDRITRIGRIIRKTKLDELPELFNVLKGDMSIVGPRPEVPQYVAIYPQEFSRILQLRPGLSDFASIKYRDEQELLNSHANPKAYYKNFILPDKLRLYREYLEKVSIKTDIRIMVHTIKCIFQNHKTESM